MAAGRACAAASISALDFSRALSALVRPSSRLVVGVSGGADSLALVLLTAEAAPGLVHAVTIDHGLRVEARAEAAWVHAALSARGIPHETVHGNVREPSAGSWRRKEGVQEAARRMRQDHLDAVARRVGASAVLVGHTRDDQLETLVMRFAKASGLDGLCGMAAAVPDWRHGIALARPLLGWSRAAIEATLASRFGVTSWVSDPSNASRVYARTRARAAVALLGLGDDEQAALCDGMLWVRRARAAPVAQILAAATASRASTGEGAVSELRITRDALLQSGAVEAGVAALAVRVAGQARGGYPPSAAALARAARAVHGGGRVSLGACELVCNLVDGSVVVRAAR